MSPTSPVNDLSGTASPSWLVVSCDPGGEVPGIISVVWRQPCMRGSWIDSTQQGELEESRKRWTARRGCQLSRHFSWAHSPKIFYKDLPRNVWYLHIRRSILGLLGDRYHVSVWSSFLFLRIRLTLVDSKHILFILHEIYPHLRLQNDTFLVAKLKF